MSGDSHLKVTLRDSYVKLHILKITVNEYQSQNNNYKISSSRESITNKGFGGLIIVRTTDVAFSTPTKIEKKKKNT